MLASIPYNDYDKHNDSYTNIIIDIQCTSYIYHMYHIISSNNNYA